MKQTKELMKVRENAYAIKHIKNPSKEMQLAAVQENGHAIEYIENPSDKIRLAATNNYYGTP